mgnify:CR=1 FL=1
MAIVVLVVAGSLYLLGSVTNQQLRSEAFRMAGSIRFVHGRAAINRMRYQLIFDLEQQRYSAQCSEDNPVFLTAEAERRMGARGRAQRGIGDDGPLGAEASQGRFMDCSEALLSARPLSHGVRIDRVMTVFSREAEREGEVALGFYPDGFVDRAMIWLRHGEAVMTLVVDPMTGRVHVHAEDLVVPRDFFDVETER